MSDIESAIQNFRKLRTRRNIAGVAGAAGSPFGATNYTQVPVGGKDLQTAALQQQILAGMGANLASAREYDARLAEIAAQMQKAARDGNNALLSTLAVSYMGAVKDVTTKGMDTTAASAQEGARLASGKLKAYDAEIMTHLELKAKMDDPTQAVQDAAAITANAMKGIDRASLLRPQLGSPEAVGFWQQINTDLKGIQAEGDRLAYLRTLEKNLGIVEGGLLVAGESKEFQVWAESGEGGSGGIDAAMLNNLQQEWSTSEQRVKAALDNRDAEAAKIKGSAYGMGAGSGITKVNEAMGNLMRVMTLDGSPEEKLQAIEILVGAKPAETAARASTESQAKGGPPEPVDPNAPVETPQVTSVGVKESGAVVDDDVRTRMLNLFDELQTDKPQTLNEQVGAARKQLIESNEFKSFMLKSGYQDRDYAFRQFMRAAKQRVSQQREHDRELDATRGTRGDLAKERAKTLFAPEVTPAAMSAASPEAKMEPTAKKSESVELGRLAFGVPRRTLKGNE
jgi:hypothetical protein